MYYYIYYILIIINIPKTCSMPKFLSDSEMEKKIRGVPRELRYGPAY